MRIMSLSFALSVFAVMTGAAAQSPATPTSANNATPVGDPDGAFVNPGMFSEPNGALMYKRVCAGCHMPDAKGAKGAGFYPALAQNPNLAAGGYPVMVILHGLNGMPPIGDMMTDQQVADVVNHIRTHFGNRYKDRVTAEEVKAAR